jgi:hypothetical protein
MLLLAMTVHRWPWIADSICAPYVPPEAGCTRGVEMPTTLTDTLIRSLRAPKSGRLEIHDEKCTGLVIRVTPAGAKTWSFRFRDPRSGVLTRATIGPYPEIAFATARECAIDLRRGVASGINPVEAKRRERELSQSRTFGALAERYLNEHARRFLAYPVRCQSRSRVSPVAAVEFFIRGG